MFSAPVTQPDHATRAVSCALEMDAFSRHFVKETQAQGICLGKTRIGVHTGAVLVGNFGGNTMFDFRALGDPITTCSRLETVNKHLGTCICVSRQTADQCNHFLGRPVGHLILQGKALGIEVFEPLDPGTAPDAPRLLAYRKAYGMLEKEDPEAVRAFSALVQNDPNDPLPRFHLKRLQKGETGVTVVMNAK